MKKIEEKEMIILGIAGPNIREMGTKYIKKERKTELLLNNNF